MMHISSCVFALRRDDTSNSNKGNRPPLVAGKDGSPLLPRSIYSRPVRDLPDKTCLTPASNLPEANLRPEGGCHNISVDLVCFAGVQWVLEMVLVMVMVMVSVMVSVIVVLSVMVLVMVMMSDRSAGFVSCVAEGL